MASPDPKPVPDSAFPEIVNSESSSDLPFCPRSPTILRLGPRSPTPFANDQSLVDGVSYYDGDSASISWPDFSESKAHRLHDIPALCSICNNLDIDVLRRSNSRARYRYQDILSSVKYCRLCALIIQSLCLWNSMMYGLLPYALVEGHAPDFEHFLVEVSFVNDCLTFEFVRIFPKGEDRWVPEVGRFKVLSVGKAEDTQPTYCVGDMPASVGPATSPSTTQEKSTDVSIYRLMSELERVIVNTAPCQTCAPLSLPLGQGETLPGSLRTLPALPDRVVEILSPLGTPAGQIMLRLKEADIGEPAFYTTLSHRWGGDRTLKTTKTSLHKHLQGFSMEELPRTFQDAVLVNQALGIRYIWIDSLCIIQDDVDDWLRQAAKMGSVYSHATFTIAAHSASQCNEGFLWRCQVPSTMGVAPWAGGPAFTVEIPEINGKYLNGSRFNRTEISDRAWVLQELTLSPRILHFYENHLFWECEHCYGFPNDFGKAPNTTECSLVSRNTSAALFRDARSALGVHDAWLQLVHRYSACHLTNKSDRLVALAGIVSALRQGLVGDKYDYQCGVFEADVHRFLLWYVSFFDRGVEHHLQRAPSWSWASVDCRVEFMALTNRHVRPPFKHLRLVGRRHQDYTDPTMLNPSCRLLLQAPVIRALVQLEVLRPSSSLPSLPLPNPPVFQDFLHPPVTMMESPAAKQLVGWCWPDVLRLWPTLPQPKRTIVEYMTFLVVQSHDCEGSYKVPGAWCLIITPVQGDVGVYERIGIAFICDEYVKKALERPEDVTLA